MKLTTFEAGGIAISLGLMVLALWLTRVDSMRSAVFSSDVTNQQAAPVTVANEGNQDTANYEAVTSAVNERGELERMIIDDVVFGAGEAVTDGDTVTVQYIGRLQNGQEFDNSYKRGTAFTFTVGEGRVISGWEQGIVGMKVGGERILVIPPDLAYGQNGFGPIPGDATLVFAIELLAIE